MTGARKLAVALGLIGLLLGGCGIWASTPLEVLRYAEPERKQPRLLVFLRGLGGSHASFAKRGLIGEVRQRQLPFDMVAPNTHYGYYLSRSVDRRLQADVLSPAREQGYEQVWLVGVSMGGLGAILTTGRYPQSVDGILLMSPFLGYSEILGEIRRAGGLSHWTPGPYTEEDWQRLVWHWLQRLTQDPQAPPLYLAYGEDDPYREGQQLLAEALRPGRVFTQAGGHDYATFEALWRHLLDRVDFELVGEGGWPSWEATNAAVLRMD